jgi:hypothetical protein
MTATFAQKTAAMGLQMAHEIDALHAASGTQALPDDGHAREVLLG